MSRDKGRLVQELDWLSKRTSGYEAVARTLKEQNTALNGQVCRPLVLLAQLASTLDIVQTEVTLR